MPRGEEISVLSLVLYRPYFIDFETVRYYFFFFVYSVWRERISIYEELLGYRELFGEKRAYFLVLYFRV